MKTLPCLAALALSLTVAACNKPASPSPGAGSQDAGAGAASKKLKLGFITNNAADFWTIARAGTAKAAADLPNDSVEFQIPGDATAATQKRIVDDMLAKGIDGIAISPVDPENQTLMLNDIARQCLLITHDSDAPKSNRACYLGTDNLAAGRQAGGLIKEALPDGGKIMVFVGTLDAQNARERFGGIKEALQGSKVEIIDVRTDDTDAVRAKANAVDAMVKYPDIAGMVGLWSYNGPAIYNAIKEANKVGAIKIICFDEQDETLAGVRDGAIYATVVQQPYEFGNQAIRLMDKVLRGDASAIPADKKIIIPTLSITKDKVDDFAAKLAKLRGH